MNSTLHLSVTADDTRLALKVTLDGAIIYHGHPGPEAIEVVGTFDDDVAATHHLAIELSGKTAQDTKLDESGNIVKDCRIFVSKIALDRMEISQIFYEQSVYSHDGNGQLPLQLDKFYGIMGCNGVVDFKFTTPVYAWLLEHA